LGRDDTQRINDSYSQIPKGQRPYTQTHKVKKGVQVQCTRSLSLSLPV
ncbi:hypothetical protein BAE44_0009832, partial [Dichanthelium oligosanthes]